MKTLEELLKDYVKPDYSKAAQEIADGSKNYGESFFWNKMFQCVFPVMEGAWDIALGQQKSNLVKGGGMVNFSTHFRAFMATLQQENTTGFTIWHTAFTQSMHVLGMRVDAGSSSFSRVRNTMWGFDLAKNMERERARVLHEKLSYVWRGGTSSRGMMMMNGGSSDGASRKATSTPPESRGMMMMSRGSSDGARRKATSTPPERRQVAADDRRLMYEELDRIFGKQSFNKEWMQNWRARNKHVQQSRACLQCCISTKLSIKLGRKVGGCIFGDKCRFSGDVNAAFPKGDACIRGDCDCVTARAVA